jgi:hypothetical protein
LINPLISAGIVIALNRGNWDSFFLFVVVIIEVLICLASLARVTFRAARRPSMLKMPSAKVLLSQEGFP